VNSIIFVYAKIEFSDNYPCSWIPYSMLSLASSLDLHDWEVVVFDGNRKDKEEFNKILVHIKPSVVAFSIMTGGGQIKNALELASIVKNYDASIINVFGGPHVNILPVQTLKHLLVDVVVVGLGQGIIKDLLRAIISRTDMSNLPGVYYKYKGKIYLGQEPKPLSSLTQYNFDLINVHDYIQYDRTISDKTINYIASQGCIYDCRFCYEYIYKKKYYKMPIDFIKRDLMFFDNNNITGVKFYDANFFVDFNHAVNISEILKSHNLKWAASIHPKNILKSENGRVNLLLKNLQKSNCQRLLMGIESGSDRILAETIRKRANKNEMVYAAKRIAEYGILGSYTFMIGFPDETPEERKETFDFIESLWKITPRPETNIHIYLPYPGTPLYKEALEMGFIPPNSLEGWSYFSYYKAMTPWISNELEEEVKNFTSLIKKDE